MIGLAFLFVIIALVAWALGAGGIAGFSMEIAKWLIIAFVILAIVFFVFGGYNHSYWFWSGP